MIAKNRRIEWTLSAQRDLQRIYEWIARDSAKYALRMVRRIRQKVETLQRFPEGAAIVPEWDRQDLRETFEGPYRILFAVDSSRVLVLSVIHGARLLSDDDEGESDDE